MDLTKCAINWTAPATLKDNHEPEHRKVMWVGEHLYAGDLAGAIRKFRTIPPRKQKHIAMLTDPGAIEGSKASIIDSESLAKIALRQDVPNG
jgi:hypothetical protein